MNDHDDDTHIQPLENFAPAFSGEVHAADGAEHRGQLPRRTPAGLMFGALAGSLLGALAAAACCWFSGEDDLLWPAVLTGGVLGPVGGAIIGVRERKARGDLVRPDIATLIGVIYGLIPALIVILGGIGLVRGRSSGLLLLGTGFVGPMTGLLLGGALDRAYEAGRRKSWGAALGFGAGGVVAAIGLLWLIATTDSAPDPKEIAAQARVLILRKWRQDPELQDARIRRIALVHDGQRVYTGSFDARIGAQIQQFQLKVTLVGDRIVADWQLLEQ